MNISLSDIRYFAAVADHQNVTRAAKHLGITQPSLSAAIQRVEKTVGSRLFLRSKSGVCLTKTGLLMHTRAKEMISYWEALEQAVQEREHTVSSKYFIGCHPSLGIYTLPTFVPGLLREHPQLEIELVHGSSREITNAVVELRLDFGIVANPIPHADLVIRRLFHDEVCFVVSEKWKEATLRELQNSVLVCDPSIYQTQYLLKQLAAKKIAFRRTLYTSRLDVVASLVDAKAGVGILPLRASSLIRTQPLFAIPTLPKMDNEICLIYRHDTQTSEASRTMAHYIEKSLKTLKK